MFKYGTLAGLKHVRNNPRTKATQELVNGLVVLPDDVSGDAPTPAAEADAQGNVYVVHNVVDKPEIRNSADFKIESGEYVRADYIVDAQELPVEIDESVISVDYATTVVGDVLVPLADGTGKWGAVYGTQSDGTTANTAADFKVNLEVIEKTTLGGNGLYCKVVVNN